MKFNMQQTVTRLVVAVCIQALVIVLLSTLVLADQGLPVIPEINMVIAASKKQSKPVLDSVEKPQVTPASATVDPAPEQTTVPLTKTQKAQIKAIDAQLRFWIAQE